MKSSSASAKLVLGKIAQAAVLLCLYMLLCELYVGVVVDKYSFGGFDLTQESRHELVVPVLLIFLLVVPAHARSMKSVFVLLSLFFLLIPAGVLCALQGSDFLVFVWMVIAVFIVVIFWNLSRVSVLASDRVTVNQPVESISFWLPFAVMVAVLAMLAAHVGFVFRYSFAEVYDYRFDFNDSLRFPLNYLLPFAGGPLAGFLAAQAFFCRHWLKLVLVVMCGVLFYGFSTHKAFLFFPPFAVAIGYAIRARVGMFYSLAFGVGLLAAVALIATGPWGDILGAVFANRLVFIPAQIHYVFFDEFSKIGFLYWAESKISLGFFSSPLSMNSVNYIGEIMTGDPAIGANVGWIANGYMNLGLFGVMIYAGGLGYLLALIDRWSRRLDSPVLLATFAVPLFSIITSSDLLIAMLTGGVLPLLLLLGLLLNQNRFSWGRKCRIKM